jgi:hypothetical protein
MFIRLDNTCRVVLQTFLNLATSREWGSITGEDAAVSPAGHHRRARRVSRDRTSSAGAV